VESSDLPSYVEFILPSIKAVADLGGSATASEIHERLMAELNPSDEMLAVTYVNRPDDQVFPERMQWGRSYAKLIGGLESPKRGLFVLTPLGRELLADDPETAKARVYAMNRETRKSRSDSGEYRRTNNENRNPREESQAEDGTADPTGQPEAVDEYEKAIDDTDWTDRARRALHQLSPAGFERFVLYLLRNFGLKLEPTGGSGDEGIDGIGTAPISDVLSSRVAVQVKRYSPDGKPVGRETVALFQRDASTKGAERAILVTLGRFSEPARKAAITTTPTVDLIDGERLVQLMLKKEVGVRLAPVVNLEEISKFDAD